MFLSPVSKSLPKADFCKAVAQSLEDNEYVVILGKKKSLFVHKCSGEIQKDEQIYNFLYTHKVSYFDISKTKGSFDIGPLIHYMITKKYYKNCQCSLKARVSILHGIPYQKHIEII